jgi:hypothetical protein
MDEQLTDGLQRHLLGTEDRWDWNDANSVSKADLRMEQVESSLGPNLDALSHEKGKGELRAIMAALRRGELPEVTVSPRRAYPFRFRK